MAKTEVKNALVEVLSALLDDAIHLETMIEQGFGDKACHRAIVQFAGKARKIKDAMLQSTTASVEPSAEMVGDKESAVSLQAVQFRTPVMVLGEDGEQRPATQEDLDALGELGAPVGSQDTRTDFKDDFGDDQHEII